MRHKRCGATCSNNVDSLHTWHEALRACPQGDAAGASRVAPHTPGGQQPGGSSRAAHVMCAVPVPPPEEVRVVCSSAECVRDAVA